MKTVTSKKTEIGVYQRTGENLEELVRAMDLYETDRPEHDIVFVTKNGSVEAWIDEFDELRICPFGRRGRDIYVRPSWANAELIVSTDDEPL